NIDLIKRDVQKRNIYSIYQSKKIFFQKGLACLKQLLTCVLRFKRYFYPDMNDEYHLYISSIKGHTLINLNFLEQLFNNLILLSQEEYTGYNRVLYIYNINPFIREINEVVFITYLYKYRKNQEITDSYYLLFKRVFSLIKKITSKLNYTNSAEQSYYKANAAGNSAKLNKYNIL
ncbi:hypothetical protein IFM47457_07204, partial [Aspergillus lentulus]